MATRRSEFFSRIGIAPVSVAVTGLAFLLLFWEPLVLLGRDWWSDPDAGHGLLLGPLALVIAWKKGLVTGSARSAVRGARSEAGGERGAEPAISGSPGDSAHRAPRTAHSTSAPRTSQVAWGLTILTGAVLLRYLSGLAAELFTMRMSMLLAAAGLIVYAWGWRQLRQWWLPAALLVLSVPIPAVILNSLAFPLQLKASQMGAALLSIRHVPVLLSGNIIHLPGQSLFVTEACSGLRSLTALVALGVLVGGLWLASAWSRVILVLLAVPVAIMLNGLRVFLMGFLVYYVSPELGEGFLHYTEGWVIFVLAFAILGALALLLRMVERHRRRSREGT